MKIAVITGAFSGMGRETQSCSCRTIFRALTR